MKYVRRFSVPFFLLAFIAAAWAAPAGAERTTVPTPPGGGPGSSVYAPDEAIPFSGLVSPVLTGAENFLAGEMPAKQPDAGPYDDIGGDDVLIASAPGSRTSDVDITSDGDIYLAFDAYDDATGWEIRVYRSQDGGDSFDLWGELSDPSLGEGFSQPSIVVAEGNENRFFMAYRRWLPGAYDEIRMVRAELSDASAAFSAEIAAMADPQGDMSHPDLADDSDSYVAYYLYLVAGDFESTGGDIHFARCTNYGVSFESSYQIGTLSNTDREYVRPRVCWGYGGWVHAVWYFAPRGTHSFDTAIRYRRVPDSAAGGLVNWEPILGITSTASGYDEHFPKVAAPYTSAEVVIAYQRTEDGSWRNSAIQASLDQGESFAIAETELDGMRTLADLLYQTANSDFLLTSIFSSAGVRRTDRLSLHNWAETDYFGDVSYVNGTIPACGSAIDPSRGDRLAMSWLYIGYDYEQDVQVYFDAEWRADPGYPNFADGFPLDLPYEPISPPAVVDLDGDGDLEIVFSDAGHYVRAYEHDGTPAPGWPAYVPAPLSDGPVAVGRMTLGDEVQVLVGTAGGFVYGFDGAGDPLPGFPYDAPTADPVRVSIGALGGPYPRTAVVTGGNRVDFIDHRAEKPDGVYGWIVSGGPIEYPAAIGDVDGDGVSEAVVAGPTMLFALPLRGTSSVLSRTLDAAPSGAPTLGDLDLDGDVEIILPGVDGSLSVFDDTGAYVTGWPQATATASPLSSAAVANILGTAAPEIACAARDWTVECFYAGGGDATNYPITMPSTWFLYGAPIITRVDDVIPSEIVIGSRDSHMWAWNNFTSVIPGWPKYDSQIELSPAAGDIDDDGDNEIVFLSTSRLLVVDVNSPPNGPGLEWPMYGYDPQRSGCANCAEDLATDVAEGSAGVTRVSFAAPAPNPAAGAALFSYALPVRSQVLLEVYDLRGRRIETVVKQEQAAGQYTVGWNCRDSDGRRVPSGVYFARLRVRGPGVGNELTRKINVIR